MSFSPKVLAISHLADVSNKNTQEFSSKCFSCLLNSFNTRLFPSVHLIKFVRQLTLLISTAITVSVLTLNRSSCKCTCYFFISCAQTSDWSSSKAGFISEVISKLTSIITIQFGFPFLSAQRSQKTTTSIMCYLWLSQVISRKHNEWVPIMPGSWQEFLACWPISLAQELQKYVSIMHTSLMTLSGSLYIISLHDGDCMALLMESPSYFLLEE